MILLILALILVVFGVYLLFCMWKKGFCDWVMPGFGAAVCFAVAGVLLYGRLLV